MRSRPGSSRSLFAGLFVLAIALFFSRAASAQLHWDLGAQVGVNKRFLGESRNDGTVFATNAGFGPTAQVLGHVALLPLVRVGGYLGYEISPLTGDAAARDMFGGGLRVKLMSPWPRGDVRFWLFVGFGYQAVHARSYRTNVAAQTLQPSTTPSYDISVDGSGGHYWELPVGIGVSYKLRKPYQLFAELGARVGFSGQGTTYERGPSATIGNLPPGALFPASSRLDPAGDDRFSLGLSLGVMIDL